MVNEIGNTQLSPKAAITGRQSPLGYFYVIDPSFPLDPLLPPGVQADPLLDLRHDMCYTNSSVKRSKTMTKSERRDQKAYKAYRKSYFGRRNNRKSLEVIIEAQRRRMEKTSAA